MTSILKADTIQDTDGNNIINENSNTITIGASGDTTNIIGTLQNNGSSLISGITMADQWRITADLTIDSSDFDIASNWEQADTTGFGFIGSAMTQSSGVFTFPSTGIYYVALEVFYYGSSGDDYGRSVIKHRTNSGTETIMADTRIRYTNGNRGYVACAVIFDCQSTTDDKIIFYGGGNVANLIVGNTNQNNTSVRFIRLGDT